MTRTNRAVLPVVALIVALGSTGCFRRTFVVVPHRAGGYTQRDTLYAQREGDNYRVIFRHDTTWRVDTVTRTDTLWRGGTRIIRDTVFVTSASNPPGPGSVNPPGGNMPVGGNVPAGGTVPRVTPVPRRDTVYLPVRQRDTVYLPDPRRGRDTVYLPRPGTGRVDTLRIVVRDTIRLTVHDTLRLSGRDTVRITVRDTVRIIVRDTVLVGGGRRLMFVPPGQYPTAGQCRIWIPDRAPGQQARAAPCAQLGPVPVGAFVLFDGVAWDMDFDWAAESRRSHVPPEILALKRP